jgi:NAD(P)-dependent dehydrogenase (short-subunit alcohol dehydrogenase family)
MEKSLAGNVELVSGVTRGAGRGIAVQLGAAGTTVYVTGRTTRSERSEMNRPETIEETAALVDEAGGRGDRGPGGPYRAQRPAGEDLRLHRSRRQPA